MGSGFLQCLGGVGIFLLGMVVLTDGLRQLAGSALTRFLARSTHSPLSGALTGAATTALVQSSSATTVAAVGFVGAGILGFSQALGIVFGANLGTTVTGWLVALLGFKLRIGLLALPLVLAGVLMRLFGRGRTAAAGHALAGFGLVFVGIDFLQSGMGGVEDRVTPASFPGDDLGGRLLLVGLGVAITLVTQSSSAGVATAMTALDAGAISLTQAVVMVIGMDVGTTFTAAAASVGGSVAARRTGIAHVVYNLMTAVMAFLLVDPFLAALSAAFPGVPSADPEIALVAFHSSFNALGVLLVLPFSGQFARLIERLVPERPSPFARRLDVGLLDDPQLAIGAARSTLVELAEKTFSQLSELLAGPRRRDAVPGRLDLISLALSDTRHYLERLAVPTSASDAGDTGRRLLAAMHALDHVDRLVDRCRTIERAETVRAGPPLSQWGTLLRAAVDATGLRDEVSDAAEGRLRGAWEDLESRASDYRQRSLTAAVRGEIDGAAALERLDAFRWLRRVAYHTWRIVHHLRRSKFGLPVLPLEEMPPHAEAEPPG